MYVELESVLDEKSAEITKLNDDLENRDQVESDLKQEIEKILEEKSELEKLADAFADRDIIENVLDEKANEITNLHDELENMEQEKTNLEEALAKTLAKTPLAKLLLNYTPKRKRNTSN